MRGAMRWLCLLALAGLAASGSAITHRSPFADLAGRAQDLDPEFAANALLRIADAPAVAADVAWRREILDDAFQLAAGAQEPFARRNWTGYPATRFDKAYAQGLDTLTLESKAVRAMLSIDYKKARELFEEIPPPQIPRLNCQDAMAYDVSIFYETVADVAARAFSPKEVADDEPFHLLQRYAASVDSPAEVAPVARMLMGTSLKPALYEALVNSFAGALAQLSGDDRSFSATVPNGAAQAIADLLADCAHRRVNAAPLADAWRAYLRRQLGGARCADSATRGDDLLPGGDVKAASADGVAQIAGACESPQCQQLASQLISLLFVSQKGSDEWAGKLRQYLAALADWKGDDHPEESFQFKSSTYEDLLNETPAGPLHDLLLSSLLAWLEQTDYRGGHRVEWFYAVNKLIVHAFADRAANAATVRELRRSEDPVISLYADLELMLPRAKEEIIRLL